MIHGRVHRADDHACLIPKASLTGNLFERMRGLLGSPRLEPEQALLIRPCSSVHTIGMQYPIDLAFLDRHWTIIKTVSNLKPWRMAVCPAAHMVLELLSGGLDRLHLARGLQLEWQDE
jgi:uncharacterized membrane protein (UPF0127 family)